MEKMPDYSSRRFLVVDDEPFMLSLIERMLRDCHAGLIMKAADGGAALKSIKDNFTQVDCIIADFNMEPVNGLQLLRGVRMGVNPKIPREQPFIMLTGNGETEVVKAALALDVHGYIVKPVAADKLVQTIDKVLKRPLEAKEAEYYRSVKVPKALDAFGDQADASGKGWTVMPKRIILRPEAKQKIEQFQRETATQDGVAEEVKIKNRRECTVNELLEGQILAQDVETDEGVVLLRRGTYLTKGMIARLRELAAETKPQQEVWVGEIAAP
jgi:YesN/AraC family two-component response regulator